MKYLLLYLLLITAVVRCTAQTYPFKDGFESYVSSQPPSTWSGDMKVLLDHGIDETKAIVADMSGANLTDSLISPLIGPLTPGSTLTFFYEIIDWANYPSTTTNLVEGDSINAMISTDGVNYTTVYHIDMDNHNPSFFFKKIKVFLTPYAGSTARIKFVCNFGSGARYFIDIDSVTVADGAPAAISKPSGAVQFSLTPNPVSNTSARLMMDNNEAAHVLVYDLTGKVVYCSDFVAACQLPTGNLNKGLYLVQVRQKQRVFTQKLVIE